MANTQATDYKKLEEDLCQIAKENPLTMVVVGCAGQGKSALVNSLLLQDPDDPTSKSAEEGDFGETVTKEVRHYEKGRDGANVKVIDTPGLGDSHNVKQEPVIQQLREVAGDKVDLYLFCIKYTIGIRVDDGHRNIIKLLTQKFGKNLWIKARLVLTMVNTIDPSRRKDIPRLKENIENQLKRALRDAGVPENIIAKQELVLAGRRTEPMYINNKEQENWNQRFFEECLLIIGDEKKRANLAQARYGKAFWTSFLGVTAGVGGATGAKVGAAIGASAGPAGMAVGAGIGGILGLLTGYIIKMVVSGTQK